MDEYSQRITYDNINQVRSQIAEKLNYCYSSKAHSNYKRNLESTITDFDHFPYTRFFRGVYFEDCPVVAEREAGWRPINNKAYKKEFEYRRGKYPHTCFENSLIFPRCIISNIEGEEYDEYKKRFMDRTCVPHSL